MNSASWTQRVVAAAGLVGLSATLALASSPELEVVWKNPDANSSLVVGQTIQVQVAVRHGRVPNDALIQVQTACEHWNTLADLTVHPHQISGRHTQVFTSDCAGQPLQHFRTVSASEPWFNTTFDAAIAP